MQSIIAILQDVEKITIISRAWSFQIVCIKNLWDTSCSFALCVSPFRRQHLRVPHLLLNLVDLFTLCAFGWVECIVYPTMCNWLEDPFANCSQRSKAQILYTGSQISILRWLGACEGAESTFLQLYLLNYITLSAIHIGTQQFQREVMNLLVLLTALNYRLLRTQYGFRFVAHSKLWFVSIHVCVCVCVSVTGNSLHLEWVFVAMPSLFLESP